LPVFAAHAVNHYWVGFQAKNSVIIFWTRPGTGDFLDRQSAAWDLEPDHWDHASRTIWVTGAASQADTSKRKLPRVVKERETGNGTISTAYLSKRKSVFL